MFEFKTIEIIRWSTENVRNFDHIQACIIEKYIYLCIFLFSSDDLITFYNDLAILYAAEWPNLRSDIDKLGLSALSHTR